MTHDDNSMSPAAIPVNVFWGLRLRGMLHAGHLFHSDKQLSCQCNP